MQMKESQCKRQELRLNKLLDVLKPVGVLTLLLPFGQSGDHHGELRAETALLEVGREFILHLVVKRVELRANVRPSASPIGLDRKLRRQLLIGVVRHALDIKLAIDSLNISGESAFARLLDRQFTEIVNWVLES